MGSRRLTQWTQSELGGLNPDTFVEPELIEYETFDGRSIPAWVYKPGSEARHPVIVYIHGGPEGQYRPGFSSTFQYWVNELDAAVVAPNVRGSAGYGKDYLRLDNGMKRKDSVKDIGALLDWIGEQPDLDADHVVVYGGSYGGYMVLASAVDYSDRLAGAVDIVGVSNFVTFLENTEDYRRDLRRAEYGDERDPEMRAFLERIAPSNNADKITKPLFIIQGANDPRVPASESEQMLASVRANETEAWYLLAKDEGHGFNKKSNQDYMRQAVTVFLNDILR
jgi:dipeptidyl aminopeptidase/acylaminoacyl peptidase